MQFLITYFIYILMTARSENSNGAFWEFDKKNRDIIKAFYSLARTFYSMYECWTMRSSASNWIEYCKALQLFAET